MARRNHPFYVAGRNHKPSKRELYILELVSCVVTAAIAYQIGKTFDNHSGENGTFDRRRLLSLSGSIRHMCQTKIVIKLGIFFESYKKNWPLALNLFTFLHYLENKAQRVVVVNRSHAFFYLGVQDTHQPRAWINRAISGHIKTVVIDPDAKLRAAMDSLRFRRNKSEAHRSRFTKKEALDITWDEILLLVEVARDITYHLDKIYLGWQHHLPDPNDTTQRTYKDAERLITGVDTQPDSIDDG